MYNEMILPSKRANKVENDPSTFLPPPAGSFSYSPLWKYVFPPVSILLTENIGFPPKFEDQNNESKTPSY